MDNFFKVKDLEEIIGYASAFSNVGKEKVNLADAFGRVLAADITAEEDLPDFQRSTMDGYAVHASSTYGSSESTPSYLTVKGKVEMGKPSDISIKRGEAAKIPTGGMLPDGADSVIMVEHTDILDETTIENFKSAAHGQHVIQIGEDYKKGEVIIKAGTRIRAQETGLLAAFGKTVVEVFKTPKIAIISTGDEVVTIEEKPSYGKIRDVNTYTISALVKKAGAAPISYGIIKDDFDSLFSVCAQALSETDMVILSGGSSVGTRDYTVKVFTDLPDSKIMAHGVSISPGKPTILANSLGKALWGLPGHIVSAMIVFEVIVKKFIEKISGSNEEKKTYNPIAKLTRNISSAQGRVDFIRVKLSENNGILEASPILGKSGLINTMVQADGLIRIERDTEGLDKGSNAPIILLG